ncbi:inorganic diphosphatase [Buchnera aphidicola]|uniref:inorganic diphosphatase n=1 Tax=Buchnera aphidicola TaxID=9 RepID=UPI00094D77F5|nr:inorganic diphosphatase [Buchnera aphidicola]
MNNIINIPTGINPPHDLYGIIEIPALSYPVKYEFNKTFRMMNVDRFISTTMFYPCNYGFLNQTLSLDGDPLDVLIPSPYPIQSQSIIRCVPIGLLRMEDESGSDEKIIAVPHVTITQEYKKIVDIHQLSSLLKKQILNFFNNYKKLDTNKWVKIKNWENVETAKLEINQAITRYKKTQKP